MGMSVPDQRLADLEARVAALEAIVFAAAEPRDESPEAP